MSRIAVAAMFAWSVFVTTNRGLANESETGIEFSRDIQPILSQHCIKCHGRDEANREAGLRLDQREMALARLESGARAIVPGDPQNSELMRRITTNDSDERMPPPELGERLDEKQIALLRRWIEDGAHWQTHWAYQMPRRPPLPAVMRSGWPLNAIDYFALATMEREGLSPSLPADKAQLLRRVTFDLTGLPPTLEELDAFLADDSPDAYEKVVDRLLHSPQFGERMALWWLDLARYADTNGYHTDNRRDMWRWRDWVIETFNKNMPFDQFTLEQLAGDLLPGATLEQIIATGFNRNHMINFEDGAIAEEYRTEYVADRVVTTGTVWLGQTLLCARCHDHKYDPFSQREFFQLFAYFNNIPEEGIDGRDGNSLPLIKAPTRLQQQRLARLDERIAAAEFEMTRRAAHIDEALAAWERELTRGKRRPPQPPQNMLAHYPLDEKDGDVVHDASASGKHGQTRGDAIWVPREVGGALLFHDEFYADLGDVAAFEHSDKFSLSAWVYPTVADSMTVLARLDKDRGYELALDGGRVVVRLAHIKDRALEVRSDTAIALNKWQHVLLVYDGMEKPAAVTIYVDGQPRKSQIVSDNLADTINVDAPLLLGSDVPGKSFRGMIDDVRIYSRALNSSDAEILAGGNPVLEIIATAKEKRTDRQREILKQHFLEYLDEPYMVAKRARDTLLVDKSEIQREVTTTMVMQEMETPRETFVLRRGDYRHKTTKVEPGTPDSLPPLPDGAPSNRLGLAEWLLDPDHPLTARVTVNRFWQMYFGAGLVRTPEDFGTRGQRPSHPELLDWLTTEFVRSGWDVKHLQKLIVMSATYRQSSRTIAELWQRDPENRLLARGPRLRMQAESIRDQALAISGLLERRIGGASVFPYQPPGLWEEVSFSPNEFTAQTYKQSTGADLYRRGMYTFWKRAVPPPALEVFGAPDREVCSVTRSTTNTSFQALTLLNDPTFVEAARAMAQRMMVEGGDDFKNRLALGLRLATSRRPTQREVAVFANVFGEQLTEFRRDRQSALELLSVGESPRDPALDPIELATWTVIADMILNLRETITK